MRSRNDLWKPPEGNAKPKPAPKSAPHDPICNGCQNQGTCSGLCPPMQWINGNVGLREALLDDPVEPSSDYNLILAEGIETHRQEYSEAIANETDLRKKCIGVLLEADFRITEIARVMKLTRRTIYRIRDAKEETEE